MRAEVAGKRRGLLLWLEPREKRRLCRTGRSDSQSRASVDAVGGDFDFGNTAEGEQELHKVRGRLFGGLSDNVGNGVGNRGLEHDALGLEAGQVHTHELSGLECGCHRKIVPPRAVKCKLSPRVRLPPLQGKSTDRKTTAADEKGTGLKTRHYEGAQQIISVLVTSRG